MDLLLLAEALQPVISLPRRARPVLMRAIQDAEDAEQDDGNLAREVDGVAGIVLGAIRGDVGPSFAGVSQLIPETQEGTVQAYVATIPPMVPRLTT